MNTVDALDFTDLEQREHQWIDQQGDQWRWNLDTVTGATGWQYWQKDECRWKYHGLSLHLFGPYRKALPHEEIDEYEWEWDEDMWPEL